jgi:hypothetical protein
MACLITHSKNGGKLRLLTHRRGNANQERTSPSLVNLLSDATLTNRPQTERDETKRTIPSLQSRNSSVVGPSSAGDRSRARRRHRQKCAISGRRVQASLFRRLRQTRFKPGWLWVDIWYEGVWFNHAHPPRYNISVARSQLSLVWRSGQQSSDTSIVTLAHDNRHSKSWRYGYFEVRARWDVVKGAWQAFWLIPVQDATRQDFYDGVKEAGELDIFEGQARNRTPFLARSTIG